MMDDSSQNLSNTTLFTVSSIFLYMEWNDYLLGNLEIMKQRLNVEGW